MLIELHPRNPEPRKIAQIIECLKGGGTIIYPTDTVYGLGCDITSSSAIEQICRIKGISSKKANFSFICNDLSHIAEYTRPFGSPVYKLMRKCLPGAFTFILNASNKVPKMLNANKKTVGIRVPDNPIALLLAQELGNPLISTSLKIDDEINEYPTDPYEIHELYERVVDMVVAGDVGGTMPSTIIDCTGDLPTLIRQGAGELPYDLD
jgi:tRNA threonylcarbamoyl adenosine modification protein (Sua5/YciO/YrdC/YwlC family)